MKFVHKETPFKPFISGYRGPYVDKGASKTPALHCSVCLKETKTLTRQMCGECYAAERKNWARGPWLKPL